MKLKLITPIDALSKAYFKQTVTDGELENFTDHARELLDNFNDKESEEHNKNLVRDFLLQTYYKDKHAVNTKEKDDLVIHHDKKGDSDVAVIIETKKRTNKGEMISEAKPNAKALHELIFYYLKERYTNHQHSIKNLIATNGYEWYIFDEVWFEKNIYRDSGLKKAYQDFKASGNDTRHFYENVAAVFLNKYEGDIPCTYVNLEDTFTGKKPGKKEVKALYKLFAPEHLLKKPFANDSNLLNKDFYFELLYILGLEEKKDGSKKLITRADKNRCEGSLLENTITKLQTSGKWKNVANLSNYGEDEEQQVFSIGLELCINWLNRVLFLKLLEGQLIRYHATAGAKKEDAAFLNTGTITSYDELNELFFEVLAKPVAERSESVKKKFGNIPYLNSSLFETSELEQLTIDISNLKDRLEMPLLSNTVLKENTKTKTGALHTLEYLFKFLDAYDFSSDENDEAQRSNKAIINAAVLGLIFEKINGYKDGSFFTPSFITMYMSRESLRRAVVQKFNETYSWNCQTLDDIYNQMERKNIGIKAANEVVNSLKICDPAVGSGHFLVSALNELIGIKHELGILADAKGKLIGGHKLIIERDELILMRGFDFFTYNYTDPESQRIQETLFKEKQTLIENCLFGVDINPKSVMICRLRLWVELLKNAYYTGKTKELQTLPNIDINIKCGNSLISRFSLTDDQFSVVKGQRSKLADLVNLYKVQVDAYKSVSNKKAKDAIKEQLKVIRTEFEKFILPNDKEYQKIQEIKGKLDQYIITFERKDNDEREVLLLKLSYYEKLYKEKIKTLYGNAFEWRFEFPEVLNIEGDFIGFDIIIGNPPYIYNRDLPELERNFYQDKYNIADDLYHYFLVDGIKILKKGGIITMITPNTYFTLSSKETFRNILLEHRGLKLTYCGFVFEDAYVEAQIFSIENNATQEDSLITLVKEPNDYLTYTEMVIGYANFNNAFLKRFFWPTKINVNISSKFSYLNSDDIVKFKSKLLGKKVSDNSTLKHYLDNLKKGDLTLLGLISEGEQGLVTGNNSKYVGTVVCDDTEAEPIDINFLKILNTNLPKANMVSMAEFRKEKNKYYELAEEIKLRLKKPTLFGKFFNYRTVFKQNVKEYSELSPKEKIEGGNDDLWIYYNRGNSEGDKWLVPYVECISWSKKSVKELKEGVVTNSRWQGETYFNATGFGWVDYFTDRIKAFYIDEGVYSKNIVKFHSGIQLTDKFIVALLNSTFLSYYIKNFITATHTLQINDGRLIPIVIPTELQENQIITLVDKILASKKANTKADTKVLEEEIDKKVYELYGVSEEEIKIVEGK